MSSVDQRYGAAARPDDQPRADADQLLPDEPFTVGGVRKAKFTTALADCVNVPAGQQTTVAEGGLPSPPQLTTAEFPDQERLMRMIVAVAESAEAEQIAPGAGLDHDGHHDSARVGRQQCGGRRRRRRHVPVRLAALGRGGQPAAARTPCSSRT